MRKGQTNPEMVRHNRVNNIVKQMWDYPTVSDTICKHFACGNKLTLPESLYGDYCLFHQCREKTLDIVDKYISK